MLFSLLRYDICSATIEVVGGNERFCFGACSQAVLMLWIPQKEAFFVTFAVFLFFFRCGERRKANIVDVFGLMVMATMTTTTMMTMMMMMV